MKSIKTKIACFLGMLAMLLVGTTATAQFVEGKPDAETVSALLNTQDAQILKTYLSRQGYSTTGVNNAATASLINPQDQAAAKNVIAVSDYRNASGNTIELYTHSEILDNRETLVTRAEDDVNEYKVVAGTVVVTNKAVYDAANKALNSFEVNWAKLWDCLKKHYKGCVNMNPCFDCIKNCFNSNNKIWKKLWCSLKCSSCYNCVLSIAKVVWCYFS
jgi:hypothetical protein